MHYLPSGEHTCANMHMLTSAKLSSAHLFSLHALFTLWKALYIYIYHTALDLECSDGLFHLFACILQAVRVCSSVPLNYCMRRTRVCWALVACEAMRWWFSPRRLYSMCCHWETHWEDLLNLALTPETQTPAVLSAALCRTPFKLGQLNNE